MHKPLVDLENVSVVRIPLGGSGIDFSPVVNPGDPVRMGQVIGESSLLSRFSIRSSVSGTVREISDGVLPDGSAVPFVTIENDGLDTLEPLSRAMDWQMMEPDSILDTICASGIVDRTGYPVFAMLGRQISSTDTLIVCGLDGEVWTSAVYRTLCDEAEDIVEGIHVLMRLFGRVRCIVAMPESAGEATDAMRAAAGSDNRIRFLAHDHRPRRGRRSFQDALRRARRAGNRGDRPRAARGHSRSFPHRDGLRRRGRRAAQSARARGNSVV